MINSAIQWNSSLYPLDSALYVIHSPRRDAPSPSHVIGSQGGVNDRLRHDALNDRSEP
jgi:hypothetical protein